VIRETIYLLKRLLGLRPRCPLVVRVEWQRADSARPVWPHALTLPSVRRNAAGRREISALIATDRWLWAGPRTIRAVYVPGRG
jgi:hypothetical protein